MSDQDFTHFGHKNFEEVIEVITKNDSRYDKGAYFFMRRALDYTFKKIQESKVARETHHIKGQELLEGIREFSLDQFGPMTTTLFNTWGIRRGEDFGEIVFNLVDYGVFGKTDEDTREDFVGILDFYDAFEKPFLPQRKIN